jgi:integrase
VSPDVGEQLALFAGDDDREPTTGDSLSPMRDKRQVTGLDSLVKRLRATADPVEQARLASQLRDRAEALVAETIREANDAGLTWREIGARLGVPFQTLYRRYGAAD